MAREISRREFCEQTALGSLALLLPAVWASHAQSNAAGQLPGFEVMAASLLREWCDGMLAVQIDKPANPAEHGALGCPACGIIHGRCMDAVYPLLHMAKVTGEKKYLEAGIRVFEWSKNVSQANGSWTVIADPQSWAGITVFGTIALAEALRLHGDLLDSDTRERWRARLRSAAEYIHATFTPEAVIDQKSGNINYACTAVLAMNLSGRFLENPAYLARSREMAKGITQFFTEPNRLLFGEKHPNQKSPRGFDPVDLGYNVEESLVALTLYAVHEKDQALLDLLATSLESHLQFMLPDGAWDNSWGTRQFKWTYWGSRTCDGSQPAYASLAPLHPAFATAVYQNTRLFQQCTSKGLLHGGPHYASHGVKPCVHHTFTHAKALATVLDYDLARDITAAAPLPRSQARGVKPFPEIATWLVAHGPWRATIATSDCLYQNKAYAPTGGAISLLWHKTLGPLLAGSMAEYVMVEKNNMQPNPDPGDHPLTPRVELWEQGAWFTQLHDLTAEANHSTDEDGTVFAVKTQLLSADQKAPSTGPAHCSLTYRLDDHAVTFCAQISPSLPAKLSPCMVLPIISPSGEEVRRVSEKRIEIKKPEGRVLVEANVPLRLASAGRIFNLVPGFQAVEIMADFLPGESLECKIRAI